MNFLTSVLKAFSAVAGTTPFPSWEDSLKSKLNASISGTKAEVCNCFGSIHIFISVSSLA